MWDVDVGSELHQILTIFLVRWIGLVLITPIPYVSWVGWPKQEPS